MLSEKIKNMKGKLIVSCQALPNEPLHSSFIMGRMAKAAMEGGALGIRANTPEDIEEIKKNVDLPVIGIWKKDFDDSKVYITPTMEEIDALVKTGTEIIALDATADLRPGGVKLDDFYAEIREKYPESYRCTERIGQFVEQKYQYALSKEEKLYLTIHIERVVSKTKQ